MERAGREPAPRSRLSLAAESRPAPAAPLREDLEEPPEQSAHQRSPGCLRGYWEIG